MKKKNLKSLNLKKHSISNLALLHHKKGGNTGADSELTIPDESEEPSINIYCTQPNTYDCTSFVEMDCECNTNTGTTKSQPPSEHQNCNANNGFSQ